MATKNEIANDMYGEDFRYLSAGQKASVTRAFAAQREEPVGGDFVKASVGRISDNGTKTCLLPVGATIRDLLEQAGYTLDVKKEKILAESTGRTVGMSDLVVNGETYAIAVEVKSA